MPTFATAAMAMAACASQGHITSRVSTASLDLQTILSSYVTESLLSTRLSFSSTSSSLQSFDDIPSCPAQRKPQLFVNDLGLAARPSVVQQIPGTPLHSGDTFHSLIFSPIAPRPKAIMMQKASIHSRVTLDDPHYDRLNGGASDREPGKGSDPLACGRLTSPDASQYTQRSLPIGASPTIPGPPLMKSHPDIALLNPSNVNPASMSPVTAPSPSMLRLGESTIGVQPKDSPSALLLVPTIMVSNSTAALALSLESSSNLHSHQDVPLAIRRGKKPPPALFLEQPGKPSMPRSVDSNSYPDIPSAFLGASPTSPSFINGVNASDGEPSQFDMGLSTMCSNLKSLVPPPPFTPTEAEHHPPSHPLPSLEPETRWAMATATQLPDADDEEWRFVQDLIVEWPESKSRSAETCPRAPSPPHVVAYTAIESSIPDTFDKGVPASTSAGSWTDKNKPNVDVQQQPTQSPSSIKQSRRKTVIIQAPDGDIQIALGDAERPPKSRKPCSPTGDRFLLDEFDEPVPFEIPSTVPLSAPPSLEGPFFTPPNSRPSSTASSAGLPIRGILKEKKSVRFSAVPSLYEYATGMHDEPADGSGTPSKHHSDLDVLSALRRVHVPMAASTVTRTPSKSSPLRKMQTRSHSPNSNGPEDASSASDVLTPLHVSSPNATMPTTPASAPMTPPRFAPPACRAWNSANSPSAKVTTMAKHPAVRALAHKPSPTRPPKLRSPTLGAGVGGAVVGAPALQSPYPTMSSPLKNQGQRRTPLKTVNVNANARQSAGTVERRPGAPSCSSSPVKQSQHSPARVGRKEPASLPGHKGKENVGRQPSQPAIVRGSLERERTQWGETFTPTARRQSAGVLPGTPPRGENARGLGRATSAAIGGSQRISGSSKMPVPLRGIFTKFRT